MRGFIEQGTTTTPFDMVVINGMSRFHLCIEALRRSERFANRAPELIEQFKQRITKAVADSKEHFEDMPEIRNWVWTAVRGLRTLHCRGAPANYVPTCGPRAISVPVIAPPNVYVCAASSRKFPPRSILS